MADVMATPALVVGVRSFGLVNTSESWPEVNPRQPTPAWSCRPLFLRYKP